MRADRIDAEPFRQIMLDRLETLERQWNDPARRGARRALAFELGVTDRFVYCILSGQQCVSFDTADKIVTRILGPMAWFEREELNEIYMSVDLRQLDWGSPVSEKVHQENLVRGSKAVKTHGTYDKAADFLGVSARTLNNLLGPAPTERESGMAWFREPICPRGHDKRETGINKTGHCLECRREGARNRRLEAKKRMEAKCA